MMTLGVSAIALGSGVMLVPAFLVGVTLWALDR
jgi:hypothetical protein